MNNGGNREGDELISMREALLRDIADLKRERDEARQKCRELEGWKESAMHVLGEWERVWEAAGRPGRLGASKADSVRELILSNNVLNNKEEEK